MKRILAPLVVLGLLALTVIGCSKPSQTANLSGTNDLGMIDVSSGNPSSHVLADGRICTVTATVLPDGNVSLAIMINETKASGVTRSSLVFEAPANGRPYTVDFGEGTVLTLALRN